MVSQVPVVGILMIVNGSLAGLMGLLFAFIGPFMFAMVGMDRRGGMPAEEQKVLTIMSIIYLALGLLILACGILNVIAGVRALKYRGRTFVLVALFANIPLMFSYCLPLSLGMMIYGLIVMFNGDVAKAFAMGEEGVPAESIKARFAPRRFRYGPDGDDYYEHRDERSLPPPRPPNAPPPGDKEDDRFFEK